MNVLWNLFFNKTSILLKEFENNNWQFFFVKNWLIVDYKDKTFKFQKFYVIYSKILASFLSPCFN